MFLDDFELDTEEEDDRAIVGRQPVPKRALLAAAAVLLLALFFALPFGLRAQSGVPGTVTILPGPPIKVTAGLVSDSTNVICVFTPSIVAGVSTMNAYCITDGVIVTSGVHRLAASGLVISAENGTNSVTCLLVKGATQPLDTWNLSANGVTASGGF